jgi:fucose 4-O-acetylase-like acetyltransferase
MKKNNMITYSRIFATFLVVLGHVLFIYSNGFSWPITGCFPKYEWIEIIRKVIYSFHMPLFFIISGFVFSFSLLGNSFGRFFWKKIKRLIIPFVFFKYFIWEPVNLIINPILFGDFGWDWIKKYVFYSDIGHLWFLLTLFIIEISMYILHQYLIKEKKTFESVCFLLLLFLSLFSQKIADFMPFLRGTIANILLYSLYFEIGYLLSKILIKKDSLKNDVFVLGVSFLLYIPTFCASLTTINAPVLVFENLILKISGSFIVIFSSNLISKKSKNAKFDNLETLTMPIYLWHQCFLFLIIYFWHWDFNWPFFFTALFLCFFLPLICSLIFSLLHLNILDGGLDFKKDKIKLK